MTTPETIIGFLALALAAWFTSKFERVTVRPAAALAWRLSSWSWSLVVRLGGRARRRVYDPDLDRLVRSKRMTQAANPTDRRPMLTRGWPSQ